LEFPRTYKKQAEDPGHKYLENYIKRASYYRGDLNMKAAVSASGKDLDSQIDPRFGRCAYFIIADTENMAFEAFDNENIALSGGAGIQSAQFVASKGAKVVLTGNIGPNAVRTLAAAGVEVIVSQSGTVRDALEVYKKGGLKSTEKANVVDHYGMSNTREVAGGAMGVGRGKGGRCGMGRGMGRGMGGGMSSSGSVFPYKPGDTIMPKEEKLKRLKDQADELRSQIEAVESSIKDLEKE
jgi:predicted Fe-Mo cluster-binding NifX family protein